MLDKQHSGSLLTTFFTQNGMPPSMAQVLTFLLLCEPEQQTSDSIGKALGLSAGSVNSSVNSLLQTGLIRKVRYVGDRRHYFELDSDGWRRATLQRLHAISEAVSIADEAIATNPHNERLIAMRDMYKRFADEFMDIAERLSKNQ